MKIIEALKRQNLLQKRMIDNAARINQYSSILSTEKPLFGDSVKDQEKYVTGLVQSNEDLFNEFLTNKLNIERTNNTITITINSKTKTITEWLTALRHLKGIIGSTYNALNTNVATNKLNRMSVAKEGIEIIPCYSEENKNNAIMAWEDILNSVESKLEIVNATTDIIE